MLPCQVRRNLPGQDCTRSLVGHFVRGHCKGVLSFRPLHRIVRGLSVPCVLPKHQPRQQPDAEQHMPCCPNSSCMVAREDNYPGSQQGNIPRCPNSSCVIAYEGSHPERKRKPSKLSTNILYDSIGRQRGTIPCCPNSSCMIAYGGRLSWKGAGNQATAWGRMHCLEVPSFLPMQRLLQQDIWILTLR